MGTDDVVVGVSPNEIRYSAHVFSDQDDGWILGAPEIPYGHPLRISDHSSWPPNILFDTVYASALVNHFGSDELANETHLKWTDVVYPGGIKHRGLAELANLTQQRVEAEITRTTQRDQRVERRKQREEQLDGLDILLCVPFMAVPPDQLEQTVKALEERAEVKVQEHSRSKVMEWMEYVDV